MVEVVCGHVSGAVAQYCYGFLDQDLPENPTNMTRTYSTGSDSIQVGCLHKEGVPNGAAEGNSGYMLFVDRHGSFSLCDLTTMLVALTVHMHRDMHNNTDMGARSSSTSGHWAAPLYDSTQHCPATGPGVHYRAISQVASL